MKKIFPFLNLFFPSPVKHIPAAEHLKPVSSFRSYPFIIYVFLYLLYNPIVPAQNPEWINYTESTGVNAAASDERFVWTGTSGGLVRVDKQSGDKIFFNRCNSGLPDNFVTSVVIDDEGNKWIGTPGGVGKYNGSGWTVYNTLNSGLPDNKVSSIVIDSSGNKWIGTWNGGLAKFNDTGWTVYNSENTGMNLSQVSSLCIDSMGVLWIGSFNNLIKYNGVEWSQRSMSCGWIRSLDSEGGGIIWGGTDNGLFRLDTTLILYNRDNSGLPLTTSLRLTSTKQGING